MTAERVAAERITAGRTMAERVAADRVEEKAGPDYKLALSPAGGVGYEGTAAAAGMVAI